MKPSETISLAELLALPPEALHEWIHTHHSDFILAPRKAPQSLCAAATAINGKPVQISQKRAEDAFRERYELAINTLSYWQTLYHRPLGSK